VTGRDDDGSHDPTVDTGVADAAAAPARPDPADDDGEVSAIEPGDVLGQRYRVVQLLGHGGMGEVYQVHDAELDEDVALKLLRAELSREPSYRARLRSEVRLARRVSHPNVCRVHDLGQHKEHLFVTMELVRGKSLRALLREMQTGTAEPMPLAGVVDVVVQLSSALAAAHRAGVLHRDVKPDNVILEDGRAVLTDFGVASLVGEGESRVVAGTPSYVAPEVLRGETFDHRSDVYSATVVAYELLAGHPPFTTRSMAAALRRAVEGTPPPDLPSAVGPAPLRAALQRVLTAGLDPDPAHRLASIDRLAEGLAAALRGEAGAGPELPVRTRAPGAMGTPPQPTAEGPVTPTSAGARRREVRVATVLTFQCEEQTRSVDSTLAIVQIRAPSGASLSGQPMEATQVAPIELPGDDLERLVVSLGGLPLDVGDRALTALFGAPVALGDDAMRAVRAARTLVARTVGGRAGLDTVRVMMRPGAADPVSPEVLRQSGALAAAAPAGEVWLSAATARQVAAHVDVAPVPEVGGQRALRVTGDAAMRTGAAASQIRPRELAQLEALARGCFEARTPTFVEVRGPAGFGKSRLREALVARVSERREVDWLVARAAPLGEAAPLSLLRSAEPSWLEAATHGGTTDRTTILGQARRWLEHRATRRPVAVVFEDLQWADEMSRALVAHLAGHLDAVPVLVVTLARDDGGKPMNGVHLVTLGPLDDEAALRLAREVAPEASDDALADVVAKAGGNPYFVEELARELAERSGGQGTLPPTVEAAVQARLDRLSPAASDVVASAAVVGRAFWREAMRAALPVAMGEADVDAALAELERRGLCHPGAPATVDDDRYEFTQAVVRDVAYGRLPARERRRAHGEVARWLEAHAGGARSSDPDILLALAHHREHGGDLPGAAAAWRLAGERCLEASASRQAHAALRRAWDLGGGKDNPDAGLAMLLGEAALESDGPAAAEEAFRAALALTPETAETAIERARIHGKLGEAASHAAEHARAIQSYQAGLDLIAPGGQLTSEAERDPRLASHLFGHLGWVLAYQLASTDPRGLAYCERAAALLEDTPHRRELARALSRLGGAYMRAGRWNEQLACNRKNLEIAQELGDLPAQITARINLGVVLCNLGEVAAAITHTEEALVLCRRTGRRATEGLAASNLAGYLIERGDLAAAERWVQDGIRLLERTGSRRVLPESHSFVARIAARRGDLAGAARAARAALDLSRELAVDFDAAVSLRVLAQIDARRGDLEAARAALDEAARLLEGADPFERARIDAARARLLRRAGDPEGAEAARARAAEVFATLGARLDLAALDDPDDVR
jgi:tetratricopeptide (TPR) repeat protein/tRNA A-37 threonylcarbamoyl transferase component Bud32